MIIFLLDYFISVRIPEFCMSRISYISSSFLSSIDDPLKNQDVGDKDSWVVSVYTFFYMQEVPVQFLDLNMIPWAALGAFPSTINYRALIL